MSEIAERPPRPQAPSLLEVMGQRYGVEPGKLLTTLKATAFRGDVSNEQMIAMLVVANNYRLNPWTREIFAFADKNAGIVPVVSVDGWLRIINEHPQFDGMEFVDSPTATPNGLPDWIECVIYRKDRTHPVRIREYMAEARRSTGPWSSHPRRMLRHKALIQCARVAFGFAGIYDEDEAHRIVDAEAAEKPAGGVADINARLAARSKTGVDLLPVDDDKGVTDATIVDRPAAGDAAATTGAQASVPETQAAQGETKPPAAETKGARPATKPAKAGTDAPVVTFAQVADGLQKAKTDEALETAALLIDAVADEQHRTELTEIYRDLREKRSAAS